MTNEPTAPRRGRPPGRTARVDIIQNTPIRATVSEAEAFIAQHEGVTTETVNRSMTEDGLPITTTHNQAESVWMFKPGGINQVTGKRRYSPRLISAPSIPLLFRQGWKEHCPDCGTDHVGPDGVPSNDPNLCPAHEPVAVRLCPVCGKRIYDNLGFVEKRDSERTDPNVIVDEDKRETTPASRTRASLDLHIWVRHPRQALMMGIPTLPPVMQDMMQVRTANGP